MSDSDLPDVVINSRGQTAIVRVKKILSASRENLKHVVRRNSTSAALNENRSASTNRFYRQEEIGGAGRFALERGSFGGANCLGLLMCRRTKAGAVFKRAGRVSWLGFYDAKAQKKEGQPRSDSDKKIGSRSHETR